MENTQEQNERNALRILAMAAEHYLKSVDELSRTFVAPQASAAIEVLSAVLAERWGSQEEKVEQSKDTPVNTPKAKKA